MVSSALLLTAALATVGLVQSTTDESSTTNLRAAARRTSSLTDYTISSLQKDEDKMAIVPGEQNGIFHDQVVDSQKHNVLYPPLSKSHCQVLYVVGVEGSKHHGSLEMISNFAKRQIDENGNPYDVHMRSNQFRGAVSWHDYNGWPSNVSEEKRREVMSKLCPNDGRRHVILEDNSFPSGAMNGKRAQYANMEAYELRDALKNSRTPHPVDLEQFVRDFTPYADVRMIALHRPFINTIASHKGRSDFHRGYLMYLGELFAKNGDSNTIGTAPWTLLCVEHLEGSRNVPFGTETTRRENILSDLALFLHWDQQDCTQCFDHWRDSSKDPVDVLGQQAVDKLTVDRETIKGIWPPAVKYGINEHHTCSP